MKRLLSIVFIWFLVVQSFSYDEGKAIAAIPMRDKDHCEAAIVKITWTTDKRVTYNCVDAGYVGS